jgi:FKBP-type peptidyl-prolyl cis-trans isomerase 2
MQKAQPGHLVTVIYDSRLENDEIFESSKETGPLEFTIGTGEVLPDFETNIIGMTKGETRTFTLPPEAGYGPHNPELVQTIAKNGLINQAMVKPGTIMGLDMQKDGQTHKIPATVVAVDDENITVDFNHPLAGQSLTFTVTLQSINDTQTD